MINVEKLVSLGWVRHVATSLASSDSGIILRALSLASLITDNNESASDGLIEMDWLKYILSALDSANDGYRLEALNVLKNMTERRPPISELRGYDITTKLIILLEEGLELDTEIGKQQAFYVLKILGNLGKATDEFSEPLYHYGSVQSFFKCFVNPSKFIDLET